MIELGCVILCGGKSVRMGASKAWLTFGDETLLQRIVGLVREVTPLIIVVAAVGQLLPVLPKDAVVVRDTSQGRGPLEGLAVGLAATAPHARLAFVTTADAPFFPRASLSDSRRYATMTPLSRTSAAECIRSRQRIERASRRVLEALSKLASEEHWHSRNNR